MMGGLALIAVILALLVFACLIAGLVAATFAFLARHELRDQAGSDRPYGDWPHVPTNNQPRGD